MITRRQAMTTNPSNPLLTAHDAGRVYAFRGMTCPAGVTPICLRGYYEAEQEMMRAHVESALDHLYADVASRLPSLAEEIDPAPITRPSRR